MSTLNLIIPEDLVKEYTLNEKIDFLLGYNSFPCSNSNAGDNHDKGNLKFKTLNATLDNSLSASSVPLESQDCEVHSAGEVEHTEDLPL